MRAPTPSHGPPTRSGGIAFLRGGRPGVERLSGGSHARVRDLLPRGRTLPDEVWRARHRGILVLLWLHAAAIPVYSAVHGLSLHHLIFEGLILAVAGLVATPARLSRRVRTVAASVGLLSASAVLVHLSGGLIEMHFHFFVMVTVVALYQDWIPFLTAITYVFVHHGVIGALDPASVFNHQAALNHPWRWALIHAAFIAGISAVCLVTWRLNETFLAQRRAAEDRLKEERRIVEVVNNVGTALAAELDLESVVQHVTDAATQLTSARFGAFFYNVVDDERGSYRLYTLSGVDREAFSSSPMPRNTAVFEPTFSGLEPVRLDDVTEDPRYGKNEPHHGMPPGHLPVRSYLAVPVCTRRGEVLGGLFFGHPEPGRFSDSDERIVVGIAAHAAVAIENARLYESERVALAKSESSRRALTVLADASKALATSLEVDAVLQGLVDAVVPVAADSCTIFLRDADGTLRRAASRLTAAVADALNGIELMPPDLARRGHPVTQVIESGKPLLVEEIPASVICAAITDADQRRLVAQLEPVSAVIVPMIRRGDVLGALAITTTSASGRSLHDDDLHLAEELARRCAVAVENARLYAGQCTTAEILQHSLLPERLPQLSGVATAARYIAGGPGVDVGGDWYDVVVLPGGNFLIALGDVVGRGVPAASLMGQLRNALRAYAFEGHGPAVAITKLNELLCATQCEVNFATLVVATYEPATGVLTLCNAGHMPPLVIDPSGHAEFLDEGAAPPIGAIPNARYCETEITLSTNTTLLLYTDGLVEDRTLSLDDGLEQLRAAAALASGHTVEELCGHLTTVCLADRDANDDVAVLALRNEVVTSALVDLTGSAVTVAVQLDPSRPAA